MEPLRDQPSPPETTLSLLRNPLTRKAVRLAASNQLKPLNKGRARRFGVEVKKDKVGGVPVKWVVRKESDGQHDRRLLINFHGGGFVLDSGSLTETIPIAGLSGIPVLAVLYRLAPEHPFPAAVDDALAVYRAALADRSPDQIAVFGTSAGAILTLQLFARIKAEGLPMPAAGGVFSGAADLSLAGDCELFFPAMIGELTGPDALADYTAGTARNDPLLSPLYGDLSGFPPIMLMTSTRDQLLSSTVIADLALRRAGVAVELRVYEGMMHAFWAWIECPETEEALATQADFLSRHLAS